MAWTYIRSSMGSYYDFAIRWDCIQSVENNTSTITVQWGVYKKAANSSTYNYGSKMSCVIGGTTYLNNGTIAWDMRSSSVGTFVSYYSQSVTVAHETDGTKRVYLYGAINVGSLSGASGASISQYIYLPTIPRATTPVLSVSSADMGDTVTIDLTGAAVDTFTHALAYTSPDGTVTAITSGLGAVSYTWTVPDVAAQIPAATSAPLTITCTTYDASGTAIGAKDVTLTASVPASVVPSISSVTVEEGTSGIAAQIGAFVQSKSKLKVTITAAGAKGSTISAVSSVLEGIVYTGASWTSGVVSGSGTVNIVTTVTDSRGRTASKTTGVTVLPYYLPQIPTFAAQRVDQYGTADPSGTYVSIRYAYSVAPLGSRNTAAMTIKAKQATASEYSTTLTSGSALSADTTILPSTTISVDYRWDIQITVKDWFGATTTATVQISTADVIFDVLANGKGFAFGKAAEYEGLELAAGWQPRGNLRHYGRSTTVAATAAKIVACDGFGLYTGARIAVLFTRANTAETITLNVNNTGAYPVYSSGGQPVGRYYWKVNSVIDFVFFGDMWYVVGGTLATASAAGLVKLYNGVDGSDGTGGVLVGYAASISAVKTAYDLAAEAKLTCLWENASPTSAFAAQTLTISGLADYNMLCFKFSPQNSLAQDSAGWNGEYDVQWHYSMTTGADIVNLGGVYFVGDGYNELYYGYRKMTINRGVGTIAFSDGRGGWHGTSGNSNNVLAVPLAILGCKV